MAESGKWGERLRARAQELGLSDSEVARRLGMTQRRYSSYVNMSREPNFEDLLRICAGLNTTPDYILGVRSPEPTDEAARRAFAALTIMPAAARLLAVAALEGMADAGQQERRNRSVPGQKRSLSPKRTDD